VVALERNGQVLVELPDPLRVEPSDMLFVCGTFESLELFFREFRSAPAESGARD
jgi:hypothetical protein